MRTRRNPLSKSSQPWWLVRCFVATAVCGLLVSCIPDGDTPAPSASPSDLAALQLSAGPLQPTFSPPTTSYDVLAPNSATSTTVTATTADATAKVTINNQPAVSGQAFGPITLDSGPTPISVLVEPPGSLPPKSYTVVVSHAGNPNLRALAIGPGTLVPAFSAGTLVYGASVANGVTAVTITASVQDVTSSMTINGTVVPSGTPFAVGGLQLGNNIITIRVSAVGGAILDYVITVTRAAPPSSDANLSSVQVTATVAGTNRSLVLCPVFSPTVTGYSVTPVPNSTSTVSVTATPANSLATLRINGQQVASGQSATVNLPIIGNNNVSIVVTAQAGNSRTYSFTVNRAGIPSNNNDLWALSLTAGPLTPVFCHNITGYSISTTQTSTTVTATVADPTATLRINGIMTPSGAPSTPIALTSRRVTIPVSVTAQNGSVMTYTVTVN